MQPFFIVIYGPTASGKSDFAQQLAPMISGEIVNADVGQFYVPFSIGTAKPDWKNKSTDHHFFDILKEPLNITVWQYRSQFCKLANEIFKRGNVPVVVGGSTFYLLSLFFPPKKFDLNNNQLSSNEVDDKKDLWDKLYSIDPERAQQIHKNDYYRIQRALNVWLHQGQKPSECKPKYEPFSSYIFINLERDREQLYKLINNRTKEMLQSGWTEEVEKIISTEWQTFLEEKKLIGYPEIIKYLRSQDKNIDDLVKIVQQKTRNYAKRQITFGKMMTRKLKSAQEEYKLQGNIKGMVETLNLSNKNYKDQIAVVVEKIKHLTS